jgi:MoaA/NifB/PqqE/SkfB family radical SAM enzyme
MDLKTLIRRGTLDLNRRWREGRMVVRGLLDTDHPVLAHVIPTRRCNLSCTYCNEYDTVSDPVPLAELYQRVDKLAELGISIITMSGGEPLLHPQLDDVFRRVRSHGVMASLITNGYLLTADRIRQLNDAGLEYLQISIDNVQPDEVSMKSLKVLDKKLLLLAKHAHFHININSVVGGGIKNPQDASIIAERARELGFMSTVGIIHDNGGQVRPLKGQEQRIYRQIRSMVKRSYSRMIYFQDNIAAGKPNKWRCRAGGRYLYICEDGLVHYCSQQRGYPGIPLEHYTVDHIREGYHSLKPCAPHCTISCVHKVSAFDFWRDPQNLRPARFKPAGALVQLQTAE